MSENKNMSKPNRKTPIWLEFLGSMNLAITLLVMLSIASVIGTVLQQNQVVQDYIIKFGPFWHEVYSRLDLYSVYGASWFMLVLLFLLVTTGVCVSRNTPVFIKDMKEFSEKLSLNALKHQPNHSSFTVNDSIENLQQHAIKTLKKDSFRHRVHQKDDGSITIAGLKGHWNRLGYFFSHVSIIVICIGALMDGNLYLKFSEWTGNLVPETRNVSLNDVDPKAWLSADNYSYRGNVNITEGRDADVLFLPYGDGYLVQQLPFKIEVKDFRLDYYDNGMPKSYESDILLYADDLDEPLAKTIEVNHPLYYKDYAIYQSSFGDGGSKVNFKVHALASPNISNSIVESAINENESLTTPVGQFRIEFTDFKLHNIVPRDEEEAKETGRKMQNNGPSVLFKVRNEQGKAWEYENYMIPTKQEGRWFFMSGVRTSVAEPFRYLFVPADSNRSKDRFFKFLALINNPQALQTVLSNMVPKPENMEESTYQTQLRLFGQLINLYRQTGFDGIARFVETNVPQDQQEQVMAFYYDQLANALQTLYLHILDEEGVIRDDAGNINQEHQLWFEDTLTTIASLHKYGPPIYFELTSFEQVQSTGLQITKSPGKDVVYFGSAMLIMGVFFMFYVRQRRVWIHLKAVGDKTEVTIAAKDNKKLPETESEFEKFVTQFKA